MLRCDVTGQKVLHNLRVASLSGEEGPSALRGVPGLGEGLLFHKPQVGQGGVQQSLCFFSTKNWSPRCKPKRKSLGTRGLE